MNNNNAKIKSPASNNIKSCHIRRSEVRIFDQSIADFLTPETFDNDILSHYFDSLLELLQRYYQ